MYLTRPPRLIIPGFIYSRLRFMGLKQRFPHMSLGANKNESPIPEAHNNSTSVVAITNLWF